MNYKLFAFLVVLCSVFFISCASDDSTNGIDEEWRSYNETIVIETGAKTEEYKSLASLSGNGSVYWKSITDFIPQEKSTKVTQEGTPYFTDSVVVRYTGWYLLKDGTKYTFDTTEGSYNGVPVTFQVSSSMLRNYSGSNLDGLATMLQHMHVGDQIEVCIPQRLGFGSTAQTYIPAYTTLWFRIKLVKIIPNNPKEWTN